MPTMWATPQCGGGWLLMGSGESPKSPGGFLWCKPDGSRKYLIITRQWDKTKLLTQRLLTEAGWESLIFLYLTGVARLLSVICLVGCSFSFPWIEKHAFLRIFSSVTTDVFCFPVSPALIPGYIRQKENPWNSPLRHSPIPWSEANLLLLSVTQGLLMSIAVLSRRNRKNCTYSILSWNQKFLNIFLKICLWHILKYCTSILRSLNKHIIYP